MISKEEFFRLSHVPNLYRNRSRKEKKELKKKMEEAFFKYMPRRWEYRREASAPNDAVEERVLNWLGEVLEDWAPSAPDMLEHIREFNCRVSIY